LGSLSIGNANRGALYNGVQMPESPHWRLVDPDRSWATRETVDALSLAVDSVVREFPNAPALSLGDMSKQRGGYFRPHRSHQSGRDVDVGYYYLEGPAWYKTADATTLDRKLTWSLVKALLTQGSVEYLFMDNSVQTLLEEYALSVEPDRAWVSELFHPPAKTESVVRHVAGHKTHMHVRFFSDQACETSKRTYGLLARFQKLKLR
ncbi:MAG TPA: penicillin-insensitive murein endopeptidase, partial [Polyangiaceae bacterium]|nr:penicillin-insensitive murein endopeptidase [Polyangiaceae bacterium]